jgi:hypothetical protein
MALDLPCPNCGTQMYAEQAHNRCPACLYYEPCCDGAPQPDGSAMPHCMADRPGNVASLG